MPSEQKGAYGGDLASVRQPQMESIGGRVRCLEQPPGILDFLFPGTQA